MPNVLNKLTSISLKSCGDFMYGRMLTDVFFMSLCLYNTMDIESKIINVGFIRRNKLPIIVFYIAIMVASGGCETLILNSMLKSGNWQCMDERYYYAEQFSIQSRLGLPVTGDIKNPYKKFSGGYYNHDLNKSAAVDHKDNGYKGIVYDGVFQGSIKCEQTDIYITDTSALGDLFLAQLKMTNYSNKTWRVGHNFRAIPAGYKELLQYDDNLIENESLKEYYDIILELTRGDLFDKKRLQLIWDFNTGKYDHLIDEYYDSLM